MKFFLARRACLVFFLVVVAAACMGVGDKRNTAATETPAFVKLAEGEGSFRAVVYDHQNQYLIRDITFFGSTTVGGVRRESDDSVTRLEFSKIRELVVLQPHFDSKHFGDKEFLLAEVKTVNGAVTSDLLIPSKLVICGVDEKTGLEKSWFLDKLNRIVVQGKSPLPSALAAVLAPQSQQSAAAPSAPVVASVVPEPLKELLPTAVSAQEEKSVAAAATVTSANVVAHQAPVEKPREPQQPASVLASFIRIIDSIIDFFRALIRGILRLVSF